MTGIGYFVFYITGSDFKTFPEVFFYFIHHRKWLFVYLYIYFPKWFLLWQEVVILFFTWPDASDYLFPKVIFLYTSESDFFFVTGSGYFVFYITGSDLKTFSGSFFFFYSWPEVIVYLFIPQSDFPYTSESDFFSWQEVVVLFFLPFWKSF